MEPNKLTWTCDRYSRREVMTDACARRNAAQQRQALCDLLQAPYDTCYTTGELAREACNAGLWSKV